ncbi:MAG: alpha-L-fucosidase [Clostridia bacterium]|nr:alpha-L-fucosidase [Clostridia bacterium]
MTKQEYLKQIDEVIARGPYKADWSSLSGHKVPDWYKRDKLGVFIHWGIYSVPAFGNEWYPRNMYNPDMPEYAHHKATYGDHKDFGYKDFIPDFKAERFDAAQWVSLFRRAGIRYVMPVAEHHDGFAMYETDFNRWNAAEMGPCRDVVGELKTACEDQGLTLCASTHRAEHYFFLNMGRTIESDVQDPAYADFYGPAVYAPEFHGDDLHKYSADVFARGADEEWLSDWLVRTCELADRYKPAILYFDWWIHNHSFKPWLKKLAAYYYNRAEEWGMEVTINYKHEAFPPTVATFDVERGALSGINPVYWQTDTAIGRDSWGYRVGNRFKPARQVVCDLVDIVSKNGNLLINVGPRPDGTITQEETEVLTALGDWLAVNGEGIYGTTFWKSFGEGEVNTDGGYFSDDQPMPFTESDFRFTWKDGLLYAFQMKPGKTALIKALKREGHHDFLLGKVSLLGSDAPVAVERTGEGLLLTPTAAPDGEYPICYKIEVE